jgi:hypothetical protein
MQGIFDNLNALLEQSKTIEQIAIQGKESLNEMLRTMDLSDEQKATIEAEMTKIDLELIKYRKACQSM